MDSFVTESFTFFFNGSPIELFFINGEKSEKDFIFINGFASPVQNHFDIFEGLSNRGYRVWAVNLPGHGSSAKIPNVTWDMLVKVVRQMVLDFKISEPVLGGFSMGGGVALRYASDYPDEVESVRVLSPFCYQLPPLPILIMEGVRFTITYAQNMLENPRNRPAPAKVYPIYYAMNYRNVIFDSELDISKLGGVKIDVVVGEADNMIKIDEVRKTLGNLPNVSIVGVRDVGHEIYYIRAGKIDEIVEKMVK